MGALEILWLIVFIGAGVGFYVWTEKRRVDRQARAFEWKEAEHPHIEERLQDPEAGSTIEVARPAAVPALPGYYPAVCDMDSNQLRFYRHLEGKLKRGEYVDVRGQIGYVFAFVYGYILRWNESGFESLHEFLTHIAELYAEETKLSDYCRYWARDCLLGLGKYELFLERTAPKSVTTGGTHDANLRLNLQRHLGLPVDPIDVLKMMAPRDSKVIREHPGAYRDCVVKVFREHEKEHGSWYEILLRDTYGDGEAYRHQLFNGVPFTLPRPPKLALETHSYYATHEGVALVKQLAKDAENLLRTQLGIPAVGEGWVSETQLYKRLAEEFPETPVVQHGSPPWLGRQHLDMWFPDWRVAVEYHGKQHFEPVEFFGGEEAFKDTQERDARKERLCKQHSVALFVVTEEDGVDDLIQSIRSHHRKIRKRTRRAPDLGS